MQSGLSIEHAIRQIMVSVVKEELEHHFHRVTKHFDELVNPLRRVSIKQAADQMGVSEKSIRRWIGEGRIKAEKCGRNWRIRVKDLSVQSGEEKSFDANKTANNILRSFERAA